MQNKTDKGTLLVSKSLPVVNSNSVNRLFSARKKKYYISDCGTLRNSLLVQQLYNFSEKLKKYSFKQLFVLQIRLREIKNREGEFIFCEGV